MRRVIEWAAIGLAAGKDISNELVALEGLLAWQTDDAFWKRMDTIEEHASAMRRARDWPRDRKPKYQKKVLNEWVKAARPFLDIRVVKKVAPEELMISAR